MRDQRFHSFLLAIVIVSLLAAIVTFGPGCAPTPPPGAAFTTEPTHGTAPLKVTLTDNSTGEIDAWEWDFNDDGTVDSTEQNPSHVYETAGNYIVLLTVTGPGGSDSENSTITVSPAPPQAAFTAVPASGYAPLQVQFADGSSGDITAWAWDFNNDGATDNTDRGPSHIYQTPGTYNVSLKVTGPYGTDTETRTGCVVVKEKTVITIGVLADFSGPAAAAMAPTVDAFEEAVKFNQEQHPVEGVTFEFVHYDHQMDYTRTVPGYLSLKTEGMDLLYAPGGTERDQLQAYLEADHMPCIGGNGVDPLDSPWVFNTVPAVAWQSESAMQWIADNWDYSQGAPSVGHQGWVLSTSAQLQNGIENVLDDPAHSGKFNWAGFDNATLTNAVWDASYEKFKDCDYIFCSTVGTSLATFVSQMRALGYQGSFISSCDGFPNYWALLQNYTPPAGLHDLYCTWWGPLIGTESDADWYQDMIATTSSNHDDWANRLRPMPIDAWLNGCLVHDVVSRAAGSAGPENVRGDAIRAAFLATRMDFEQTGNTLQFSTVNNTGLWTSRLMVWNVAASRWQVTTGNWYTPVSLPG